MRNILFFGFFVLFFLLDIVLDVKEGIPLNHIWHEVLLFGISIVALVWQLVVINQKQKYIVSLDKELLETKRQWLEYKEKNRSNAEAIRKLIDQQFIQWQLSQGEKDVALLLIKGLSMKEISDIRDTQEKTVRQQATQIYRKSSLSGRQELSAFFLEDILSTPIITT